MADEALLARAEEYISYNKLDQKVANELRELDAKVLLMVLDRGDLIGNCKNPSALAVGRIRDARAKARQEGGGGAEDVEDFISRWGLDEKAAEAMREAPAEVAAHVIDRGGLAECRNPNAVVLARIGEARQRRSYGLPMTEQKARENAAEIEKMIEQYSLDEKASSTLRAQTAEVQQAVIDGGQLDNVTNPSAVVLGRIKNAKNQKGAGYTGGRAKPAEVDAFIESEGVDEKAGETLRSQTPEVQLYVIREGSLANTTNPNAVVMARIRKGVEMSRGGGGGGSSIMDDQRKYRLMEEMMGPMAPMMMMMMKAKGKGASMLGKGKAGGKGKGYGGGKSGGVMGFIRDNGIDERAAEALIGAGRDVQEHVMAQGSLRDARNPNAVLQGRLRKAREELGGGRSSPY